MRHIDNIRTLLSKLPNLKGYRAPKTNQAYSIIKEVFPESRVNKAADIAILLYPSSADFLEYEETSTLVVYTQKETFPIELLQSHTVREAMKFQSDDDVTYVGYILQKGC